MGTISVSLPSDGETIDAADYNTPINTIVNEFNGNIENANIKSAAAISTSKLADDAGITNAKIANDTITGAKINWSVTGADAGIWWEEIGRTTLSSAGDTITLSSLPARKYLKIYISCLDTGGTIRVGLRYNNDTGTTYDNRASDNGGADATAVDQTSHLLTGTAAAAHHFVEADVINIATSTKLTVGNGLGGAADGTAPSRREFAQKWHNTSDQISRIDVINSGTGDFAIGSEIVVLGHN